MTGQKLVGSCFKSISLHIIGFTTKDSSVQNSDTHCCSVLINGGYTMYKQILVLITMIAQCVFSSMSMAQDAELKNLMKLTKWERGIKVESRRDKMGFAYFWFYEWHLFDAVNKGEHTQGSHSWKWTVDADGRLAQMNSRWLKMRIKATENGAKMVLEIENTTDYDWPDIAAIIPCFNPGNPGNKELQNPIFLDENHEHTALYRT